MQASKGGLVAQHSILLSSEHSDFSIDEKEKGHSLLDVKKSKKKPKGSSQPKGPWVNICKKVNGKHPPCGRPEATDKSYPKCRAAGVAGKMSDSQKKAACSQKRRAEKTHSKSGTGNPPKMVSYKPKKKTNESYLINIVKKTLKEQFNDPRYQQTSESAFAFQCLRDGGKDKTIPFVLWLHSWVLLY